MAYIYRFIPASLTPKDSYIDLMQETLREQFYNASDVFTIEEETAFASGIYRNVDARINYVVDTTTGERVGDDWKKIIFSDLNHPTDLGRLYRFDNNYWITVDVDKIKTLAVTVTVKRCNNMLRWMDRNGGVYSVPCSIAYLIKENRDYSTAGSNVVVPSGMIEVTCQSNNITNKIKPNQRFLFGNPDNWTAYRVEGGGIANFNLQKTSDNTSSGVIRFSMATDYDNNHVDDIVNGIADVVSEIYSLTLNESSITGDSSQTVQLRATILLNGVTVSRNVVWSSNHPEIATVSATGLVTFIDDGSATITCSLENNASVNDTCSVTVGALPVDNYQVIISPVKNYILENDTQVYTAYLYKNGIQQADTFVFTLNPNTVPSTSYIYQVLDGNSFSVTNYGMFLTDTLDVTAVSGIYSAVVEISLRGVW